jgi:hypothetical protein
MLFVVRLMLVRWRFRNFVAHGRVVGQSLRGWAWFLSPLLTAYARAVSLPSQLSLHPSTGFLADASGGWGLLHLPSRPLVHRLPVAHAFLSHCRVCACFWANVFCLVVIFLRLSQGTRPQGPKLRQTAALTACTSLASDPNLTPYIAIALGKQTLHGAKPSPFRTSGISYTYQTGVPGASVADAFFSSPFG